MKTYNVKWSDGNAAASRGGEPDHVVNCTVKANDENELFTILFIARDVQYLEDIEGRDDEDLKEAVLDYYGLVNLDDEDEDTEEAKNLLNDNFTEEDLANINTDGIDGGDPWIINVYDENNNCIYDSGCDVADPENTSDLPTELVVPADDWNDWKEDYEDIDWNDEDDIREVLNELLYEAVDDYVENDLTIRDFGEPVGAFKVDNYDYEIQDDGSVKITNIEWKANMDW